MRALVTKTTGKHYLVRNEEGSVLDCAIKGNLRLKDLRTTNPVAVGDYVTVQQQDDGTNWITEIQPRRNYIIRRATNLSKEAHILAANIDQVLLLVTLQQPETNTTFIDRFLATAEAYRVPVVLLFNKIDLLNEEQLEQLTALRDIYRQMGYATMTLSLHSPHCLEDGQVRSLLKDKTTLLAGNSGVGKSTLLNALFGCEVTRTGEISNAHHKGMHTTTFSEMYELPDARIIDIPGIKGFGAVDMIPHEISHYFRDIFAIGKNCRYGDCLHIDEPGCAVTQAIEQGQLAPSRYISYLSLLDDSNESKYR